MTSAVEQQLAIHYLETRTCGNTYRRYYRKSAIRYVVIFAGFGAIIIGCLIDHLSFTSEVICFFSGFILAAILRDFAWVRVSVRAWPFHDKVIDWEMVEMIANGNPIG